MAASSEKSDLHRYLQKAREALLWKLDGLSEYDVRRPLVPTGTNLLGLVKHAATVEVGYFGECFGRPFPEQLPWTADDAGTDADMWVTPEESRADVVDLYRRAWAHADATIEALPLDATGRVPWWSGAGEVTLHRILLHVVAETSRHAGHADIVRELIDGAAGMSAGNDNLPAVDPRWWSEHRARVEEAARRAGGAAEPVDLAAVAAERERLRRTYLRPADQRPASTARGLHHTALVSGDVERTIRFYDGLLGFPLTELVENRDYPGSSHFFFDIGNGNLLAFFDFPGLHVDPYAEVLGGLHHVAISVEHRRWRAILERFEREGVEHVVHSEVSVYFADPDGARIELIADPLGEMYGHRVL